MPQRTVVLVAQAAAFLLALQIASAYDFNFSSNAGSTVGYTNGIYDSAQYFEAHNINVTQYTVNLTDAMRSSNGEAEAAGYGFGNATAKALDTSNYRTCVYINAGAIAFDPTPNGAEGAEGQSYIADGFYQARGNRSTAARGVLAAGKQVDRQYDSHIVSCALEIYSRYLYETGQQRLPYET